MPKKNKTACKRRKYQRCRGSRNQKNNNRRTRTIRRGGLPPDPDNFNYESLYAGTYPANISAILTELAEAVAEMIRYSYLIPPEYFEILDPMIMLVKSFNSLSPEEIDVPKVRASIISIIANIKETTAICKENAQTTAICKEKAQKFQEKINDCKKKLFDVASDYDVAASSARL